jgi:hypothetical protein
MPDFVIAFNAAILRNLTGGMSEPRASFTQDEVIGMMCGSRPDINPEEIFAKGWLNIESIYEQQGWIVNYDKPGYNETYAATFTFVKR